MAKEIPGKDCIQEMMDMQAKAKKTVVEMLARDVKSELRLSKNEVNYMKKKQPAVLEHHFCAGRKFTIFLYLSQNTHVAI